jgi:hypothetical protein
MAKVHALLQFPATGVEHRLASVRVRVEDIGRADAAADVLGSAELTGVVVPADGGDIPVDVEYTPEGSSGTLTVRAHGSSTGADAFVAGDFLSTRSIPPDADVVIPLQAI